MDHQALGDVALGRRGGVRVDVHDVGGLDPGLASARRMARVAAATGRVGLGDVVGVGGDAGAERPRRRSAAPRALACSSDSRTRTPAPSPSTKPSRPLSQGRETRARARRAFLDSAIMLANAAIGSGWMAASVPPATHDVGAAEPDLVDARARCASLPEAQAETGVLARRPGRRASG